jgi:hypothetical protein
MPRVTITFDLPEEDAEFRAAIDGCARLGALRDIDEQCRLRLKHGEVGDADRATLEEIRAIIREANA